MINRYSILKSKNCSTIQVNENKKIANISFKVKNKQNNTGLLSFLWLKIQTYNKNITLPQMKQSISQRLHSQAEVDTVESRVYQPDRSLIHELNSLLQDDQDGGYVTNRTINAGNSSGLKPKKMSAREYGLRSRKNSDTGRTGQQIIRPSYPVDPLFLKQPPPLAYSYQQQKQSNSPIYQKFTHSRSALVKQKALLQKQILQKCPTCRDLLSEVHENRLLCRNLECRINEYTSHIDTFPLLGMLYNMENPSCSKHQLQQLSAKIQEEVSRLERQREEFLGLGALVGQILGGRGQGEGGKDGVRGLVEMLVEFRTKRKYENESQIIKIRNHITKLPLKQCYSQFEKWNKINPQTFKSSPIAAYLEQYKPLCLKPITSQLAEQISDVSDGFNMLPALLNVSECLSFNLSARITKMVLNIDGPMQLKRENFLMIQSIRDLQLIFNCRKTSRQLSQLFNILPPLQSLSYSFDYKSHSHPSSQSYPLLTKSSNMASKSLHLTISNGRLQLLEDLLQFSQKLTPKYSLCLNIGLNPVVEQELPDHYRDGTWAQKVFKLILANVGSQVVRLRVCGVGWAGFGGVQGLLNGDFGMLMDASFRDHRTSPSNNRMQSLLHRLCMRKKLLLCQILVEKQKKEHPLHNRRSLLQSAVHSLF